MLTEEEARRYSRQVALPEIGVEGQLRLAAGRVMVVGLGGLGSIAAYYLAAAGVGYLKLIDRDRVAVENLNRQILHSTFDLERPKPESAAEKLSRLNPHCRIEAVHTAIEDSNAAALLADCDVIFDATDNRETRQVLNRLSLRRQVPFVYGGISGWEGMASTFIPGRTACFSCLFPPHAETAKPAPPPVLGPTAGIVASIQCLETIRLLVGCVPQLAGRLLRFSGLTMEFRKLQIDRNPGCPVCGAPAG
ncbi:MAG: HesA/MoeB/ThiF family protein [Deltaproteobacteria bacterium]|nr:HesA/MoeB/ThiF family protein [Deltaproteobacteria bacterium]